MGIKKYVFGKHKIDIDAKNFILAAGIIDNVQIRAINNLTIALKQNNIWSKMLAIYPLVGGTALKHKFNLKNPIDSNSAFRLVFTGSMVHSSNGIKFNPNSFADSFFIPLNNLSIYDISIGFYSRTQSLQSSSNDMGSLDSSKFNTTTTSLTLPRFDGSGGFLHLGQTNSTDFASIGGLGISSTLGFFIGSRTSVTPSSLKYFINGELKASATTNTGVYSLSPYSVYIGAINTSGSANFYSNKECSFSFIGTGMTDTEVLNLNNIVQNYQIELGRQV